MGQAQETRENPLHSSGRVVEKARTRYTQITQQGGRIPREPPFTGLETDDVMDAAFRVLRDLPQALVVTLRNTVRALHKAIKSHR